MEIVINPEYQSLNSFVKSIPSIFDQEGTLFYSGRNQLKTYHVEGYDVIVKSFKKPFLFNRIAYTFFRPSKAKRSFKYAFRLLGKGISTPTPIAYIEEKICGLLNRSYYISIFDKTSEHIRAYMSGEKRDSVFMRELAEFVSGFHAKGVYFKDMTPGNILHKKEQGKFRFSLVDINRMKFVPALSLEKRYKSIKKVSLQPDIIASFAREYARCCGMDEEETLNKIEE